jgi:hypothetical protein
MITKNVNGRIQNQFYSVITIAAENIQELIGTTYETFLESNSTSVTYLCSLKQDIVEQLIIRDNEVIEKLEGGLPDLNWSRKIRSMFLLPRTNIYLNNQEVKTVLIYNHMTERVNFRHFDVSIRKFLVETMLTLSKAILNYKADSKNVIISKNDKKTIAYDVEIKELFRKYHKPTYIDKNQIENLFDKPTLSDRKLFIPHIESKIISKFALQNGFAEIVREYRSLLSKDQLISSPSQGAVALHLRRMDSNTGLNGLDSWYLRNEWYEKVLRTFYSKTDNLFCFTNSLLEAEFLREICPDVRVFGPEISPLNTILSISTFNNLILSRSTLSYWAGEVSSAQNIYSAFPSTHNFSPNNSYNFVPPL